MNEQYIVAVGSLAGGFNFYGPFDDEDKAEQWAGEHTTEEWDVWPLNSPSPTTYAMCPECKGLTLHADSCKFKHLPIGQTE